MTVEARWTPVVAADGHRWEALVVAGTNVDRCIVWLPALGVPARSYEPFARALAARGMAVVVHEWRGFGSSSLRASRSSDWAYRELLMLDVPATLASARASFGRVHVLGGHSLGGQLASCTQALAEEPADALWLVASGSPFWRVFPRPLRFGLPWAYRLLNALARMFGALPGRRIGFGGNEARGVIHDWSRTGLTGHYRAPHVGDIEPRLVRVTSPLHGVLFARDWLAPRSSLDYLVGKMRPSSVAITQLDAHALGTHDDHFAWMKTPEAVVDALLPDA
ncbi:alpha/beta fold hydrolase [Lysobacter sp. TY2-98]|uniref:alpha/beta hydrolase family protein n=1 Tax=Lysobacter sp. TY2-98 TaxID=2290922 RepID=UPI000E20736C|nr:alpha/beta fold hydrolase [Lysobacter sp. TY2-98]AXK71970.1 alpha/beta fold hydrolase [Lysobacter sp. TY2-98]